MKNPAKLIAALIIVAAIALIIIFSLPGGNRPNPSVGERVQSQDGTAELVDFFAALSGERYTHAAQYVEQSCDGSYCMMEQMTGTADIVARLQTLCADHVCQKLEMDTVGDQEAGGVVRIHEVAFLDEEGKRQPMCFDDACGVMKLTTSFRMHLQDGKWYVADEPPTYIAPPARP